MLEDIKNSFYWIRKIERILFLNSLPLYTRWQKPQKQRSRYRCFSDVKVTLFLYYLGKWSIVLEKKKLVVIWVRMELKLTWSGTFVRVAERRQCEKMEVSNRNFFCFWWWIWFWPSDKKVVFCRQERKIIDTYVIYIRVDVIL